MPTNPPTEQPGHDFSNQDGESRNRDAIRILLALRKESLMRAVAEGSKVCGAKLDYGNASAWMREIPGRFGQKKQEDLLRYLGIENHRLSPERIHWWVLPGQKDTEQTEGFLRLLETYAGQLDRFMWLRNPSGALRGLAILAGGVSIIFRPTAETNSAEMTHWLAQFKCTAEQDGSTASGVKTDEIWQQLIANQLSPEALWSPSKDSTNEDDWRIVIEWAKQNGLGPEDTKTLLQAALLQPHTKYPG
ncbi:MAG: hypothetical protein PF483_06150 [Halothiobacillus sp.]|jgi:hypothetical protein|nr:hypothetical protein [Halothiobacillus sp.]